MIKPVKFALTFNSKKANTLDELKDYFSIDIVEHYKNGSLLRWLTQRDLQKEISALKLLYNTPIEELYSKLAEVFNIDIQLSEEEKEKNKLAILIQKAEVGDAEVQVDLGNCYKDGNGITQDYAEAVKWYRKAAEQGNKNAQNILANIEAAELKRKTIELEHKVAEQAIAKAQAEYPCDFIFVQGGTFQMGSKDGEDDEKPVHSVTLSNFYIGKYQVTQKEWQSIMGNNPSEHKGDNLPVEQVSWNDCQEFIKKLNAKTGLKYRLPTEAEWEFAARGGNQSRGYKYSGSDNIDDVAWYSHDSGNRTYPVGQKQANELGIYDMSGNVLEWCSDWYSYYNSGSQTNPQGASSGTFRVLRGGSYCNRDNHCLVAFRFSLYYPYFDGGSDGGFRLARTY